MRRIRFSGLALLLLAWPAAAPGGDWPQYRYDAGRTAASPEQLPAELHLQWIRRLPAPRPAFPAEVRLRFDATYEPVVLGKLMFVPSMVTDSVTALDVETGAERWQFFAEGPIRFAPVAWQDRVYFVSDDGHLYCVSARDGSLQWKFRGAPPDKKERKLLGHGRLISLWPARGGPLLEDGVVYFAAGIWSDYGVAIHALDAKSGRVIWSNTDSNEIPKANMDHGVAHVAGLTPQGYLAMIHQTLVVPCGAQLPALLEPKTGQLRPYTMGWGGRNGLPKGTWFVAGVKNYLSHGGDLYDITRPNDERFVDPRGKPDFKNMLYAGGTTRVRIDPANQKDLKAFSEPVFASDVMVGNDEGIVAYDLAEGKMQERGKSNVLPSRRDDVYPDKWEMQFRELWRLPSPLRVHIKAGGRLYLGGAGVVQAVAIPQRDEEPQVVWQAEIEGTPQRMLAADGKLFLVTREGAVYAFARRKTGEPIVHAPPGDPSPSADAWTKTAADIIKTTGAGDGYAVLLGAGSGRLAEELVRQSSLDVIAIERDAAHAAAFRRRLHRAGLYGTRVSVHVGDPLAYPLPPYLARLVVSEDWSEVSRSVDRKFVQAVFHPLRPYGGTACVAVAPAERKALLREVADSRIAGATALPIGDWVLVSRIGALPGAADWSHAEADAANTGASEEQFLKAPLELLWFDGPARWFRTPGTTLVRVCGGRMLIKAERLQAVDVYTGRRLWETTLPFSHGASDQVVALDDALYVAGGDTCLVLNPETGRQTGQIGLPADVTGNWGNLRAWKEDLVGQVGKHLVCLDRRSGKLVWKHECTVSNLSIAIGDATVFCAEVPIKRRGENVTQAARTRAFNIRTGKLLWQIPSGSEVRYSRPLDLVVLSSGVYRAGDGSRLAPLPQAAASVGPVKPESIPRPLFVIGRQLLFGTLESFTLYDLPALDRPGEATTWMRRGCTVPRASAQFVTTRVRGNAACVDLASREIIPFMNVRAACSNNLFPANGVLNMPSLTGGCTCNYLPVSQAYVPASVIPRTPAP